MAVAALIAVIGWGDTNGTIEQGSDRTATMARMAVIGSGSTDGDQMAPVVRGGDRTRYGAATQMGQYGRWRLVSGGTDGRGGTDGPGGGSDMDDSDRSTAVAQTVVATQTD